MSNQRHIRKRASLKPTSTPLNPLKTRGFGKGIQARNAQLPKSNPLQTRPFGTPSQGLSQQQETRSIEEQMEGAAQFGYNAANIQNHAPETSQRPVQRKQGMLGGWNPPPIQRVNPVMNRSLQMKQGGVIDSGITHVPGSNHSLVQRDNPEWEALIAQLSTADNWNAPDMVETNWNTSGLMLGMMLEIPQQPTEIQIALPEEVPAPPQGTTRQDNTLQSPNTPNCPSGNCHYSPRPQIDTSHFEEISLYLDRQTAWESIQEKISNVATGWNGLVPLITAYNNAQNDSTLQTPEMGIQAFDQGESGNLAALAEQQEVPRTGASGTTLGALFANESSTDLNLNSRDQRAIDRASRSSAVEEAVLESQAADADVRTAVSDVQTKVDAVAQALEAVETAEAGLQLAQAENAQENAQRDYDRAVKARDSMKSDVKDLLDLTKGLVSLGGGDNSSLWDLAGLAASRIVDASYARQISRAKTKLNQSIARVQGSRIEVGQEALEDAQAGVRTALSDLDTARQAVKAPLIRRRAAYNALAAVAGRRGGGNSQTRNRIAGAIGAIPPTEVVVQRISAIENAANSTLSRVNYTRDSGIGYTMAQHSGNQQTLNTFLTRYGFIYAASSQMGEQKRHWEARLQSLRDVVTSLGGLQGEESQ